MEKFNSLGFPVKPVIPEATYMIWLDCRGMDIPAMN